MKHRSGYAIPDIRLAYDGAVFEVSAYHRVYTNPDVRFWAGPSEVMTRLEAEAQLSQFIDMVIDRLASQGVGQTSAALRWARVQASRQDPDETAFCESAGALRLDPYQIEEAAAASIEKASEFFEGEPLNDFLAGARTADRIRLIEWIERVEKLPRHKSRLPDLQPAAEAVAAKTPARAGEPGWSLGYRRAQALRKALGLSQAKRFPTFRTLAGALGASEGYALAPAVDGIRLLRSHREDGAHLHLRTHGTSAEAKASHLFTLARGIADVACFPDTPRAPVNDLRSAYRQAAGRAFAAEFLAPANEVQSMRGDGRDTVSIADEFAVSTTVNELQIENAQRIAAACGAMAAVAGP